MQDRFRIALATSLGAIAICIIAPAHATKNASDAEVALQHSLTQLADQARPGTLGITIADLQTGRTWRVNAERTYPMMSVFKAPLGATVLSNVDRGLLTLDQTVLIERSDLVPFASAITSTFKGDKEVFTVQRLLEAAISHSDNTAADALLKLVGGPAVVTAFLRSHGIQNMRVDRGEKEIAQEFQGRGALQTPLAEETPVQVNARRRRGYAAYLHDPRDRTTPEAAVRFLKKLWQRQLLSPRSTRLLLTLLYNQTVPNRLRAGVPPEVRLADKCGTSYSFEGMTAAFNDIGILTWPNGHTVIVAAFLTASRAPEDRRSALFKDIARAIISDVHP